ncbi:hypothetical protein PCH_Pc16g07670 [Penicillium rubens Wisconsin 54-1255]|uniref:Uncharacterized protein n=1 Tax=Penicillium rubens (strain ATCC 28089 / DSM 1075 / NRRL 1951 / Wisconsin 54-1255) TaxID=500485 RepID=B6H7W5_PENRW|nr:hypothetical protein PCH_Pc16g07670 [Penicillium rubens Wisconsin 54-1255]
MRSMLKSKSAVYAGDGAMDRSWEDELHCFSIETSEGGWGELQPEDRVSQISFQLIRSLGSQWHPHLDQRVVESRTEGGVIPREIADSAGYPSLRCGWIRSLLQGIVVLLFLWSM